MSRRSKIKELEQEIEILRKEKADLRKVVNGEKHITGVHCIGCANLVEVEEYTTFVGKYNVKYCKLDFNCKDRVEMNNNCNLTTCRYNENCKCTNEEKRKECVEVSGKVLCEDER